MLFVAILPVPHDLFTCSVDTDLFGTFGYRLHACTIFLTGVTYSLTPVSSQIHCCNPAEVIPEHNVLKIIVTSV